MLELTTATFADHASTGITVVDFWAEWCGPCKTLAPAFAEVANLFGDKALFAKVNVDDDPGLAQQFQVLSIPTIVVLRDGEVVGRIVGARSARQLNEDISRLLA
jgi:thioredoxin 1